MPDPGYWLRRMLRGVYTRDVWYHIAYDINPDMALPAVPEGLRLLRDEELLCGYSDQEARDERIRLRLKDQHERGLGLASGDRLVYDTWIHLGSQLEPNTGLLLEPGEAGGVLLDSWTHPEWRGRGLHGRMIQHRLYRCAELGLHRVEVLVHGKNCPAQKAQFAAGAQLLKKIIITRLLGWRRVKREDCGWHELHLD
jgi:GNAT superfamily N-acetyltransferase